MSERLAKNILKPINPSIIVVLGIYTVLWGIWLANPFWDVFSRAPLYGSMKDLLPEFVWGIVAIVSGFIIIRGATKPSYNNLVIGSCVSFSHWFMIAIFYFVGDWQNTGGITSAVFAIYSAIIYLNIKINHAHFKRVVI